MKNFFTSHRLACCLGLSVILAFAATPQTSRGQQAGDEIAPVDVEKKTQDNPESHSASSVTSDPATTIATEELQKESNTQQSVIVDVSEAAAEKNDSTEAGGTEEYLHGKLEIGTRSVYRSLTNSDSGHRGGVYGSGTLLGTIYAMDVKQDYLPTHLFLTYYFSKYFGLELAWDSMHGKTLAADVSTGGDKTDGELALWGPTLSLMARLPNSTAFTPYLGFGLGYFEGSFNEDAAWSYSLYSVGDVNRVMVIDNTTAILATAGVNWAMDINWKLDFSLQYVKADPDATFYGYINGNQYTAQTGHFPMDNIAVRLGIVYSF